MGIVGLLLALGLVLALGRHVALALSRLGRRGDPRLGFVAWGASVLLAQVLMFSIAKQAFGDPFVLAWLGVLTGMVLVAGHDPRPAAPGAPEGLRRRAPVVVYASPSARSRAS